MREHRGTRAFTETGRRRTALARRQAFRKAVTKAFTLIELLVVIVILGVLMAVALPTYLRQQDKAKDSRTKSYLSYAYHAIRASMPENGQVYAASTTMVSWIQQSEPELTAQSGNCYTGISTAPQDAIVVDSSSTQTSLVICARAQSGNVWKLTASNTGTQTLIDGTLVPFTVSGNEITDTERAESPSVSGHSYDGYTNDSSYGIWEGTTNLATNGGFETDTSGWAGYSGGYAASTLAQDTSTSVYGRASMKVTANNTTTFGTDATWTFGAGGVPAATVGNAYTFSGWLKATPGFVGKTIRVILRFSGGANPLSDGLTIATLTNGWVHWSVTNTVDYADRTTISVFVIQSASPVIGEGYYADGFQLEQKPIATPYVETNGAVATRSASSVSFPQAVLNADQGWVAIRMRMGWNSTASLGFSPRPFDWRTCPSGCIIRGFAWNGAGQWQWAGYGVVGPSGLSWNAGDYVTFIGKWTTSGANVTMSVSDDGSAFAGTTSAGAGAIPTSATIGSAGGGSPIDADIMWLACGVGTLSDSDAATINGWGNNDPTVAAFPASAQATMVWNAGSANGSLK